MTDIQVKTFKVLPKQEEAAPIEISEYAKGLLQHIYKRCQEEASQRPGAQHRWKQDLLNVVRETSAPYRPAIISYLQSDLDHWLKLSAEDIEYMNSGEQP